MLLHRTSLLFKLFCLLPHRLVWIESARVGTNCVDFYNVFFRRTK